MSVLFPNIEAVRRYDHRLANDPRNFASCIEHLNAAPDGDESHLRLLSLRVLQRTRPPAFEPSKLEGRQIIRFNFYESELRRLKIDQCLVEKHREKLKKRGIPHEDFFLYPYLSRGQRRRQRERLLYIRQCLKDGDPIKWSNP
jgi:hypothetical protein